MALLCISFAKWQLGKDKHFLLKIEIRVTIDLAPKLILIEMSSFLTIFVYETVYQSKKTKCNEVFKRFAKQPRKKNRPHNSPI